jgi:hypothetical protein
LTFDWPRAERFPWILFGCVFLSLVAHAASFFVFQVVYPQRVTIPFPPQRVSLLTPSSPENRNVLRWIAAEDPALVARTHSVAPTTLLEVPYRPSYQTVRTSPRGSVEPEVVVEYPPARPPLSIVRSAAPRSLPPVPAVQPAPTGVTFSAPLHDRPPTSRLAFSWRQRASEPLEPLSALLGVTDRGEVQFALLQHSSGNQAIDREAIAQLQRITFPATESAPVTWAFATVSFGQDAYLVPAER